MAVVGAGAFGGWTAISLLRRGARVTLIDAWGPANARASSGGETRVIRAIYGPDGKIVRMVVRALALWRENEARWSRRLFRSTGVLWLTGKDDRFETASLPLLREAGLPVEELTVAEAAKRYPQINFKGIRRVLYEKEAGYILARRSCQDVVEGFVAEGGEYRQAESRPGAIHEGRMAEIALSDGSRFAADHYVFACGPWLGKVFADVIGDSMTPTRQEVFFFGTPPGDARYRDDGLPVWVDHGARIFYGIPAADGRGFKVADDSRGPVVDPTTQERVPTADALRAARDQLRFRFPGLADAPLLESRVCQYENTPDGRFIIDRHPEAANVWIAGGGSGHGFKHGPVVGEQVADLVLGVAKPDPYFSISRFAANPAKVTTFSGAIRLNPA